MKYILVRLPIMVEDSGRPWIVGSYRTKLAVEHALKDQSNYSKGYFKRNDFAVYQRIKL